MIQSLKILLSFTFLFLLANLFLLYRHDFDVNSSIKTVMAGKNVILSYLLKNTTNTTIKTTTAAVLKENTFDFNLTKNVRLFCLIKTLPANFDTRVKAAYDNCFKYCTDHRFLTIYTNQSKNYPNLKFLHPNNWPEEIYKKLTDKLYNGIIQTENLTHFDWYMVADDDSFVNMKNLYSFLSEKNKIVPVVYGHHFQVRVNSFCPKKKCKCFVIMHFYFRIAQDSYQAEAAMCSREKLIGI